MRPLAAQAVRYARGQLSLAVRAVAQLPLRVPDEQLYWCEARGDELLIAGERGITEWQGLGDPLQPHPGLVVGAIIREMLTNINRV